MKPEVIESHEDTIEVFGKSIFTHVIIRAGFDEYYDDSLDDEETKEKIESGYFQPTYIQVEAIGMDEIGTDTLGGCLISTRDDILELVDTYKMDIQAKIDLSRKIQEKHRLFTSVFKDVQNDQ